MILALDNLSTRYHCLPSEVLATATTFDLRVSEIATMWFNRQNNPEEYAAAQRARLTETDMQSMIDRVRNRA